MEASNTRIAKNTLYLYARLLVSIVLGLLTTRIVLSILGVSDYGVYTVVAGVTSLFTIFNSVLESGSRRFMAYSLASGDINQIKSTFSTSLTIHCLMVVVVLILVEVCGLWILNNKLNISPDRMNAANIIFQFAVIELLLQVFQTPYIAAVTAHEHFNVYAALSLLAVIGKIILLLLLYILPGDKLIVYAGTILLMSVITTIFYVIYCMRNFAECPFAFCIDKKIFRELSAFSGWSLLGNFSAVANFQGTSILLNIFFNTAINAARGVANSVLVIIGQLASGFVMASEPQLVKYHAAGEHNNFIKLIFNITQCSQILLGVIAVPVLLEMDYVLSIWLRDVPPYTSTFIKITVVSYFVKYSFIMIDKGIVAIGKIKLQNVFVIPIYLLNLPVIYILLKLGMSPTSAYVSTMLCTFLGVIGNLYVLCRGVTFPWKKFVFGLIAKGFLLITLASIVPLMIKISFDESFLRFFIVCILSVVSVFIVMYRWGISADAQMIIQEKIIKKLHFRI